MSTNVSQLFQNIFIIIHCRQLLVIICNSFPPAALAPACNDTQEAEASRLNKCHRLINDYNKRNPSFDYLDDGGAAGGTIPGGIVNEGNVPSLSEANNSVSFQFLAT